MSLKKTQKFLQEYKNIQVPARLKFYNASQSIKYYQACVKAGKQWPSTKLKINCSESRTSTNIKLENIDKKVTITVLNMFIQLSRDKKDIKLSKLNF